MAGMQSLILEYAKNCAAEKKLKLRQAELREKLIPFLKKYECPDKGPFIVELEEVERSNLSWKSYAMKLARKLWGEDAKSEIKQEKRKVGKETVYKLVPKINPNWKGK